METTASLFHPLPLAHGVTLPNRLVMGPMTVTTATSAGHVTDWIVEWYRRRARGGVGAIIGAAAYVAQNGRGWPNAAGIAEDSHVAGWRRCAEAVHGHGALFGMQLYHAGGASHVSLLGHQPVAPSAWTRQGYDAARAMTALEIDQAIRDFAAAAKRSVAAGCDFVEIHGAHGYLVHQFWRQDVNRRTDAWGNPLAFPSALVKAVRNAIGPDVPLLYRFSVHADSPASAEKPVTPEGLQRFISALEDAGVDVWDISCWTESRRGFFGTETLLPDWVRRFSTKPRIVSGNMLTPSEAALYINEGHAEAVALARALISDAYWAAKAATGRDSEIRIYTDADGAAVRSGVDPSSSASPPSGQ